jgi:hypothetical protein
MSACNALMQASANQTEQQAMPCHEHMAGMTKAANNHKSACKISCATLCASLCGVAAIPSNIKPASLQDTAKAMTLLSQSYASITLPSPQRPPILLS